MLTVSLQWRRTTSDKGLELWVNESGSWVKYKQSKYYKPDAAVSSTSGFATFQNYYNLSKKDLFKLSILEVRPKDMKDEEYV